ncbi:putative 2OG-Fe(II) oxygenase [Sphingomicrobium astaxanthinifaciens]|uniref:putative 2OG-Fe(II) oxygenase n=1 Tax=Sphingomicrobium astaxanthinifaciens TaxID=1227949 RepID=UPI001FCB94FE|nr:putative 2OG-Fe(II) oxygenase [Sphingomicrobium astaxanthinifaciens]MCJ7421401.1 2OG-Fe(II) oxygenase family protein [Sphingomicrobium astaxanthinifaciens]
MNQVEAAIGAALERWDEDEAARLIEAAAAEGSLAPARLVELARRIDRNDLAVALLEAAETPDRLAILSLRKEMGEPVADAIADAIAARGDTRAPALLELVSALEMEGRASEAARALEARLAREPGWIAGHQALAQLRWMMREGDATASFAAAVEARPDDEPLRAAYLGTLKTMEDGAALDVAWGEAIAAFPNSPLIAMVGADLLSERGRVAEADEQFRRLVNMQDRAFDAARLRHLMRTGRIDELLRVGAAALQRHGDLECWAWFGAALRASGHPQADWFYRGESLVSEQQVELDAPARRALATRLRALHHAAGPPLGQSPRGGSQTFGNLFKRRDPEIVAARAAILRAVRTHVEALPAPEPQHPFLSRRAAGAVRMVGSWSILLRGGGHHVPHIHSHGWLSSALYVDLPERLGTAGGHEGWLQIGQPPIDGGRAVEPLARVRPAPLKLALFPSIFWHGTLPFETGERLTMAFDMVPAG